MAERWDSGSDNFVAVSAVASSDVHARAGNANLALAILRLLNGCEGAVALLETLSGNGVLPLLAATVASLVVEHAISGKLGGRIDLLGAVA